MVIKLSFVSGALKKRFSEHFVVSFNRVEEIISNTRGLGSFMYFFCITLLGPVSSQVGFLDTVGTHCGDLKTSCARSTQEDETIILIPNNPIF